MSLTLSKASLSSNVAFVSTTRYLDGGAGKACSGNNGYKDFNLATHVGDDLDRVIKHRELLIQQYNLPSAPKFLQQTHSDVCLEASSAQCLGDAVITHEKGVVCCVMTADCLPIFASNQAGTQVGVAHAGWQGIVNGIIESFIAKFDTKELVVHFGPAISQANFEVGQEVYDQFVAKDKLLAQAFIAVNDKYKLDIYQAARIILNGLGVDNITGGTECTYAQKDKYFSYRRDGAQSGRMAHLIWIK